MALNTYILLYPKAWLSNLLVHNNDLYEMILSALNDSADMIIREQSRIYSGGLHKLEPNELKQMPIMNLPEEVIKAYLEKNNSLTFFE